MHRHCGITRKYLKIDIVVTFINNEHLHIGVLQTLDIHRDKSQRDVYRLAFGCLFGYIELILRLFDRLCSCRSVGFAFTLGDKVQLVGIGNYHHIVSQNGSLETIFFENGYDSLFTDSGNNATSYCIEVAHFIAYFHFSLRPIFIFRGKQNLRFVSRRGEGSETQDTLSHRH